MKVTLKELAAKCGCSITSVSRALKNDRSISKELREKVRKLADELGYVPNSIAESMRTGFTNTIAIILQDFRNPYFSIMAKYIEEYATSMGYSSIIMTTSEIPEKEINAVYTSISKNVDGVLLLPIQKDSESVKLLKKFRKPFILVGRYFEELETDYVIANDHKAAYLATRHLIEKGHKKILFISGHSYISSAVLRLKGFKKAMDEAGLHVDPEDVIEVSSAHGECRETLMQKLKEKHEYTAIFAFSDLLAHEALYTLRELGIQVPSEMAIVGIDDLQSHIIFPIKMTSVSSNVEKMAKESIKLLLKLIKSDNPEGTPVKPTKKVIDVKLSLGETT
jgi:LacI family transcriptional regulator